MLKMFLSASAVSSLAHSVLSLTAPSRFNATRQQCSGDSKTLSETAVGKLLNMLNKNESNQHINNIIDTLFTLLLYVCDCEGAALLGVGMAVAGSCPGNVLVLIGSGIFLPGAVVFAGGLAGAFACMYLWCCCFVCCEQHFPVVSPTTSLLLIYF
jgi:hypothetical protein